MTHVFVVNTGSSSIKFALFRRGADDPDECARGQVEGLGARRRDGEVPRSTKLRSMAIRMPP